MLRNLLRGIASLSLLFTEFGRFWEGFGEMLRALCHLIRRLAHLERRKEGERCHCCVHLPSDVYKRPDPLIYAQYYLMKMGLAVTWDNPDIQLFEPDATKPDGLGAAVASVALKADHDYKVRVRVWNGSYDAPAVGLPVHLSYLTFGVGTTSTFIGTSHINLGVKGSEHHPGFALFDWRTPAAGGHYCLQARLEWADDANPDNNLGQENVNVGVLHSPADFTFMLHNDAAIRRQFIIEADVYKLPKRLPCDDPRASYPPIKGRRGERLPMSRLAESRARWDRALAEQGYGKFAVPSDWKVTIDPKELFLSAGEEQLIKVSIEPTGPEPILPMAFNIGVFALYSEGHLSFEGGVTLYVTKQ